MRVERLLWENKLFCRVSSLILTGAALNVSIQENLSRTVSPPVIESNLVNISSPHLPEILIYSTSGPLILSVQEQQNHLVPKKLIIEEPQQTEQPKVLESQKLVVSTPTPSLEPQITPTPKPTESPTPTSQPQVKENKEVSFECQVLYYHEILSPVKFKVDLINLISKGYKPLSLERYTAILKGEEAVPSYPTFLVTFDDGFSSQLNALPKIDEIQKETGIFVPITFFVMMEFDEFGDKTVDELGDKTLKTIVEIPDNMPSFRNGANDYLTKKQISKLIADGINVQSQGMFHSHLPKLTKKGMQLDIFDAEKRLNQFYELAGKKRTVKAFVYPFGEFNLEAENYLTSIGIDVAFTTEGRTIQNFSRRKIEPRIRMG